MVDAVPADLSLACFPFEEGIIDRGSSFEFDRRIESCSRFSAEDLIVMKTIAGQAFGLAGCRQE